MDIKDDTLYILVEGEPNSPEVESFGKLLFIDINTVNYEFIEIGGSGNFNTVAKLIYNRVKNRDNSVHKIIPVLAIADHDFREYSLDNNISDKLLIENNRAKIIYWERHEWENLLLDELDIITSILNQLPTHPSNNKHGKSFKEIKNNIEKEFIDSFLLGFFQERIHAEFIECLKFRFSNSAKQYPKLKEPEHRQDIQSITQLKQWYISQIAWQSEKSKNEIEQFANIFDQILEEKEYSWKNWLEDPRSLLLENGKKYFRGKEAFQSLFNYLSREFKIGNLSCEELKELILSDLEKSENSGKSTLVAQLNSLISPYLDKAKEVLE